MDNRKKKRLEASGWKAGTAGEFLELSNDEEALVEMKLAMSDFVRTRRTKMQLTQQNLAQWLKSSQSRVAKIESGDPSVSLDLLMRAAFAVGASRSDVARAVAPRKRPAR